MKNPLHSLLLGSSFLVLPQLASASLVLVGYHDFTVTPINQYVSGFSGSAVGLYKNTVGGSLDRIYGSQDSTGDENEINRPYPLGRNDGLVAADPTTHMVFSVHNGTGVTYVIESLLLDASRPESSTAPYEFTVKMGVNGTSFPWTLTERNTNPPAVTNSTYNPLVTPTPRDYNDFSFGLARFLGPGETAYFEFTPTSGEMRFDNMAVTGFLLIPEPGSLLALGCVVGSGAFLRTRRRGARS